MINSPIEKLRRFLKLEISRNCDNRAVVGGLEKFLPNWQKESATAGVDPELIAKVSEFLTTYEGKDNEGRKKSVQEILHALPEPEPRPDRPERAERAERPERQKRRERTEGAERQPREQREQRPRRERPVRQEAPAAEQSAPAAVPVEAAAEVPAAETVSEAPAAPQKPLPRVSHEPRVEQHAAPVSEVRRKYGRIRTLPAGPSVDSSVDQIPGIGISNSKSLAKLGVYTVRDLLYYLPRRYDDYSKCITISRLVPDDVVTVIGVLKSFNLTQRGKYQIVEAVITDGSIGRDGKPASLRVVWFNRAWIMRQFTVNMPISLSGKIDIFLGRPVMTNPEWEPLEQDNITTKRIVPVYTLNSGLKQNYLRRMLFNTVRHWATRVPEFLPDSVLESADLMPLPLAIEQIHFPDNREMLGYARGRLAFDEVFLTQLNVLAQKQDWNELETEAVSVSDETLNDAWVTKLPYKLTNAQLNAIADIRRDMASGHPMNRLVQGDVGSGKTVVASIAALIAVSNGGQAAIMAPTGVLAEQHYRNFLRFLENIGESAGVTAEQVELITGSTPEAKKREIRERLENGEIRVIIGTHALIEAPVVFRKLTLAVIDEQHRFGVEQRAALRAKGTNPNLLVMTATPIPRSLSLTIYGDLDLTLIDEMPEGRQPVTTFVMNPLGREAVYRQIDKEIAEGHQAFIIYPLVEEGDNEENEGRAAIEASERLQQQIFPDRRVALLHGRMKGAEKDAILEAFKNHEYDILVSTSVIEVGVDVPNATVMVIEGANRFGLAQLHQFRGRVGRGSAQSRCFLIPEKENETENQRLQAMVNTNDGFKLAEMDLEMRGPGDFIGKRQSGMREMKLASLADVRLIEKARNEAARLFEEDPHLDQPDNAELKARVQAASTTQQKGEIS